MPSEISLPIPFHKNSERWRAPDSHDPDVVCHKIADVLSDLQGAKKFVHMCTEELELEQALQQHKSLQHQQKIETVHTMLTTLICLEQSQTNLSQSLVSSHLSLPALLRAMPWAGFSQLTKKQLLRHSKILHSCQMSEPSTSISTNSISHVLIHSKPPSQILGCQSLFPLSIPRHTQNHPNAVVMKNF